LLVVQILHTSAQRHTSVEALFLSAIAKFAPVHLGACELGAREVMARLLQDFGAEVDDKITRKTTMMVSGPMTCFRLRNVDAYVR